MNKLYTKMLLVVMVLTAGLLTSCNDVDDPKVEVLPTSASEITALEGYTAITIKDLKSRLAAGNDNVALNIEDKVYIEARVNTTDRYGNFYRSFYCQDATSGIEIKIGKTQLYNIYHFGQTIYVRLDGLCLARYNGGVSIGLPTEEGSKYPSTWIDQQQILDSHIFRGSLNIDNPLQPIKITSTDQLSSDNYGMLVDMHGITFTGEIDYSNYYNAAGESIVLDELATWAIPNVPEDPDLNAGTGQQIFRMGSTDFVVRTSGYAKFSAEKVTDRVAVNGICNITCLYTVYQKGTYDPTYQLILNTSNDVVAW